jgi:hypothetical protein
MSIVEEKAAEEHLMLLGGNWWLFSFNDRTCTAELLKEYRKILPARCVKDLTEKEKIKLKKEIENDIYHYKWKSPFKSISTADLWVLSHNQEMRNYLGMPYSTACLLETMIKLVLMSESEIKSLVVLNKLSE